MLGARRPRLLLRIERDRAFVRTSKRGRLRSQQEQLLKLREAQGSLDVFKMTLVVFKHHLE